MSEILVVRRPFACTEFLVWHTGFFFFLLLLLLRLYLFHSLYLFLPLVFFCGIYFRALMSTINSALRSALAKQNAAPTRHRFGCSIQCLPRPLSPFTRLVTARLCLCRRLNECVKCQAFNELIWIKFYAHKRIKSETRAKYSVYLSTCVCLLACISLCVYVTHLHVHIHESIRTELIVCWQL